MVALSILLPFGVMAVAGALALMLPLRWALLIPVFLLPWYGLTPDIGVAIPLSHLLFLVVGLRYLLSDRLYFDRLPALGALGLATLVGLVAATVTLGGSSMLPSFVGGGLRNGWFRVVVVVIKFLWSFLPVLLLVNSRDSGTSERVLRTYVISVSVLCAIGVLQFLIYEFTGLDILPLGLFSGGDELRSGTVRFASKLHLRPGSLAGEPKSLGMCAASVVILLIGAGRNVIGRPTTWVLGIGLAGTTVVLTQSTSALLSVPAALAVLIALRLLKRPLSASTVFCLYLSASTLLLVNFTTTVWSSSTPSLDQYSLSRDSTLADELYQRSLGRIEVEDFDWVILRSMRDEPQRLFLGYGFGLGHIDAARYIPKVWEYYMLNRVIFPKTGATYFLVNGGALMVVLMCWFLAKLTPTLESHRIGSHFVRNAQLTVVPLVVLLLLRIYIYDMVLLLTGAFYAYHRQERPLVRAAATRQLSVQARRRLASYRE